MGNGTGVSRGDRNRNARLTRLRALVPVSNALYIRPAGPGAESAVDPDGRVRADQALPERLGEGAAQCCPDTFQRRGRQQPARPGWPRRNDPRREGERRPWTA